MVELDTASYCDGCPFFEAKIRKSYMNAENCETRIVCEHKEICQRLAKKLQLEPSKASDAPSWIYASLQSVDPEVNKKIEAIEKALGFKLFYWQKYYILHGEYRCTGLSTANAIQLLCFHGDEPIQLDCRRGSVTETRNLYNTLADMKQKLTAVGIKTCDIIYKYR